MSSTEVRGAAICRTPGGAAPDGRCSPRPCSAAAGELCDRHAEIRYHSRGEHLFCPPGCDATEEAP